MYSFLISLGILIGGYLIYGAFVERLFGVDSSRKTPAYTMTDGIDYMPMPTWKVFLIQFLNIAGLGPIFGAIMGVMFGTAAFLWIALGTIFAGAVHDFLAGMLSIRSGGKSLPELVGDQLGTKVKVVMELFSVLLLILLGAVFVVNPADLLATITPWSATIWIAIIFVYFFLATLLPIDKVIGNLYPVFGIALLFMAVGILAVLLVQHSGSIPEFTEGLQNRQSNPDALPIFPMMFISIACGAISGFHATQSPLMARCMKNEKYARPVFYGAMVTEGIVALIWAAAAVAFAGSFDGLAELLGTQKPARILYNLSTQWLGMVGGFLAMLGVIFAPITSGDTALRSARLIVMETFKIKSNSIAMRLLVSVALFAVTFVIMNIDFTVLWRYFAWSNQTLSVFTLWTITVYLARKSKPYLVTLIPAVFMTMVTTTYICFAPEGLRLGWIVSIAIASVVSLLFCGLFVKFLNSIKKERKL